MFRPGGTAQIVLAAWRVGADDDKVARLREALMASARGKMTTSPGAILIFSPFSPPNLTVAHPRATPNTAWIIEW